MSDRRPLRYRAPTEDGAALIDPPLSQLSEIIDANVARAKDRDAQLGMPAGFSEQARRELLSCTGGDHHADRHTAARRPLILAGHQPTLFHPGVWFKNFLLSSIAENVGGSAVNLIIDNDTIRNAAIHVPTSADGNPSVVEVPFDAPTDQVPWEERYLVEPDLFHSFPQQVHQAAKSISNPLLDRVWHFVELSRKTSAAEARRILKGAVPNADEGDSLFSSVVESVPRPGHCITQGRHLLESELGLSTSEVAIGSPFFTRSFARFAEQLIVRHEELWLIHHQALAQFRLENHVRSRAHPVPDLARDGDWLEVPLWLWSQGNPRRRRVFARCVQHHWEITDCEGIVLYGTSKPDADEPSPLQRAELDGIKLRPRALITTMYARLVLSDLFIHGIGGAKYDELTDEIIRRFFGIEPPRYLTATATFRLPIDRPQVTIEDVRDCVRRIRDVRYRPESFVGDALLAREPQIAQELAAFAAEKREYVRTHTLRRGSEEAFQGVDRINRAMHELLRPVEEQLRREHARLVEDARRARLLGSREFSFVLFPEEYLVPRLLALAQVPA